jgi:hypothetical protein
MTYRISSLAISAVMNETRNEQEDNLRRYLLHELDDPEQEQIEMRLLTDKEFSRQLAIAQEDLIDDFVTAKLSDHERERFRNYYLITPDRQQKIGFATALDRYVIEREPSSKPDFINGLFTFIYARPFKTAISFAGLLLIFAALALYVQRGPHRDLKQEFVRLNRSEETDSKSLLVLKQNSDNTRVLALRQNVVREDAESRSVEITSGVVLVRLLLEIGEGAYDRFNGTLQTSSGQNLATVENLKARDESGALFVVVNIPAEFLTHGDYQLRLTGIGSDGRATDVGPYPFHVVRR